MTKFFFFDSPGNTAATAAERKAEESGWETVSKHTNNTLCGVMNPPWFILYLYNFDPLDHGCRLLFFGFFLFPTGCVRRQESRCPREIQWKRNKRKTKRHRNYLCDVLPPPFLLKQHFVICLREIKVRYIFLKTTSRGSWFFFFVCVSGETIKNNKTRVVERGSVLHFTPLHIKSSFFFNQIDFGVLVVWLLGSVCEL